MVKKIALFALLLLTFVSCSHKDDTISFESKIDCGDDVMPTVSFCIGDDVATLILDTGSEISIINESFYQRDNSKFNVIDSIALSINTVSGRQTVMTKICESNLNDSIPVTFYVMDINDEVVKTFVDKGLIVNGILGCDFLYKHNVVIDFKNKTISNIK